MILNLKMYDVLNSKLQTKRKEKKKEICAIGRAFVRVINMDGLRLLD